MITVCLSVIQCFDKIKKSQKSLFYRLSKVVVKRIIVYTFWLSKIATKLLLIGDMDRTII